MNRLLLLLLLLLLLICTRSTCRPRKANVDTLFSASVKKKKTRARRKLMVKLYARKPYSVRRRIPVKAK